ncbi:MAG: hypothetical protein ACXW1W_12985, partial [Methylococcaceae bacterium]
MSKISQSQKVVNFLLANPLTRFGAREIAQAIVAQYPEDYQEKRENPRFSDDKAFLSQVIAEIGAQKEQILKGNPNIFWQDKPRPRVYWFDPKSQFQQVEDKIEPEEIVEDDQEAIEFNVLSNESALNELQLYPLLVEYL